MDPALALKSLLLQNDHIPAEVKLLPVTPAMHWVLIHWRHPLLPTPPPSFSKAHYAAPLTKSCMYTPSWRGWALITTKKAVTLVANFISISKDNSMLNMILICDMPLKLCYMLRMLTPHKWHVLCPYLYSLHTKWIGNLSQIENSNQNQVKIYLVIPLP